MPSRHPPESVRCLQQRAEACGATSTYLVVLRCRVFGLGGPPDAAQLCTGTHRFCHEQRDSRHLDRQLPPPPSPACTQLHAAVPPPSPAATSRVAACNHQPPSPISPDVPSPGASCAVAIACGTTALVIILFLGVLVWACWDEHHCAMFLRCFSCRRQAQAEAASEGGSVTSVTSEGSSTREWLAGRGGTNVFALWVLGWNMVWKGTGAGYLVLQTVLVCCTHPHGTPPPLAPRSAGSKPAAAEPLPAPEAQTIPVLVVGPDGSTSLGTVPAPEPPAGQPAGAKGVRVWGLSLAAAAAPAVPPPGASPSRSQWQRQSSRAAEMQRAAYLAELEEREERRRYMMRRTTGLAGNTTSGWGALTFLPLMV